MLHAMNTKHGGQRTQPPSFRCFRVKRLNHRFKLTQSYQFIKSRKEKVFACFTILVVELVVGKSKLMWHNRARKLKMNCSWEKLFRIFIRFTPVCFLLTMCLKNFLSPAVNIAIILKWSDFNQVYKFIVLLLLYKEILAEKVIFSIPISLHI